ncbi:putative serine/threonine-protein phosphatase 4 regulatory subunit 1-like isoform X3 [Manis pentadactyla]|uniref:putative serine/threonine-protein phosphatase 4 regulatory subunit 1-like isoform X3 n=1 Tax=Manis pentadactyla TaxID=143292 RepID=UPI00255CE9C6|nr:putative serine/threonine-protein phosphatase 4 regulatory subunit 1-like isoform X3 [Manis pentadactyla]
MHIINLGWKTKELQSSFLSGNPNGFEDYGPDCNGMRVTTFLGIAGQDNLPPLTPWKSVPSAVTSSISKLASPVHTYSPLLCLGQIIARGLLDVFRDFHNNEDDFLMVMEIVVQLSEDADEKHIALWQTPRGCVPPPLPTLPHTVKVSKSPQCGLN